MKLSSTDGYSSLFNKRHIKNLLINITINLVTSTIYFSPFNFTLTQINEANITTLLN